MKNNLFSLHPSNNQHEQPQQHTVSRRQVITRYEKAWLYYRDIALMYNQILVTYILISKQSVLRAQSAALVEQALLYHWCTLDKNIVSR